MAEQMFAELSLDHKILKGVIEKAVSPFVKPELVDYIRKSSISVCDGRVV